MLFMKMLAVSDVHICQYIGVLQLFCFCLDAAAFAICTCLHCVVAKLFGGGLAGAL